MIDTQAVTIPVVWTAQGRQSRRATEGSELQHEGVLRLCGRTILVTPELYADRDQAAKKAISMMVRITQEVVGEDTA